MAFAAFTSFSETPFSSLPSNIYLSISGQQVNTTLGNIVIDADGNITIQTGPEIALDVNLENVTVGLASLLSIQGQESTISQGEEIISASATTGVLTGEEVNLSLIHI